MPRRRFCATQGEHAIATDIGLTLRLSENALWPIFVTGGGSSHREVESGLNRMPDANLFEIRIRRHVANVILGKSSDPTVGDTHSMVDAVSAIWDTCRSPDPSDLALNGRRGRTWA